MRNVGHVVSGVCVSAETRWNSVVFTASRGFSEWVRVFAKSLRTSWHRRTLEQLDSQCLLVQISCMPHYAILVSLIPNFHHEELDSTVFERWISSVMINALNYWVIDSMLYILRCQLGIVQVSQTRIFYNRP